MTYTTWDTETTIGEQYKRISNQFTGDHWVVTHAFKNKDGKVIEERFGRERPYPGWFRKVLENTKLLVGANIKFDILHAIARDEQNLHAWMTYVADGGRVWDIQLAEYLLEGMVPESHMLSLDEMAPRYGGNVKVDEVKKLWGAGVKTEDIEPALLTRYLCGGNDERGQYQQGDIENTETVFLGQLQRARDSGQLNSILLNMGALIGTTELERNGLFIDKPRALELAEELRLKIEEIRAELLAYLPEDLPFEFNWGSRFHKSALIFGGTVQYDSVEYVHEDGTGTLCADWDAVQGHGYKPLTFPQKEVIACYANTEAMTPLQVESVHQLTRVDGLPSGMVSMEDAKEYGIPVLRFDKGKREGEVKTKREKVPDKSRPKTRKCKAPYTFKALTKPKDKWKSDTPGVWSVSEEVIEELATRGIPFIQVMHKLQKMTKDLGTYFITTDANGKSKGMLTLVGLDGLVHHKVNQTSTVTARFSASDPNSQNIPKGKNSKIKTVFVSRFGDDGLIIQSDFRSLEIYIQAILTKCKQLIQDLRDGLDMHCLRLAAKEGMPYEEVVELCKGPNATEEWKYKRTGAKEFSFQRAYGAGVDKISETTGLPPEDVEALIKADNARYPEIEDYFADRTREIKKNRRPMGKAFPHPDVRGVICNIGRSFARTPDGKKYAYTEQPSPEYLCKKGQFQSFSPTEIKNYEVQGEGAEWAKAALYLSVREFYRRENFGGLALLINQVHDAEYADAHKSVALDAASLLHACMEFASEYMEFTFKWDIPVPVPSETAWGKSMADEDHIDGLTERAAKYRQELRDAYMPNYLPTFERHTHA